MGFLCLFDINIPPLPQGGPPPQLVDGSDSRPGRVGSDENPAGERSSALTRSSLGRSPGD